MVQKMEKSVLIILALTKGGDMQLKSTSTDIQFETIYSKGPEEYDFDKLVEQLKRLKERLPWLETLVLQPEDEVKYDVIIKIMDQCRENGFPNISMA